MARRPGRPRASGDPHGERDTRQDVLDAAAALFCSVGFTSTSTRAIADAAGVRQASIYHHFAGKDAILLELLLGTVQPSLELADALVAAPEPAPARLWSLVHADVALLAGGPVNLGVLYVLPEVAAEQFAPFHVLRARLRARYSELADAAAARSEADDRGALVLGLVESVILRRRDTPDLDVPVVQRSVADAVLRLIGCTPTQIAAASTPS
ncbi:TetR/AcrR family transcriptional regulator [Cellulomonas rhizosphaerae]|uniref:TetR/AcrR family transcriptional regulator n=1 Tax=Cellulomonas rhizosphaerae TaxID=2293719 RepID=A0A413RHP3_9CELL|nr:TetR/AcrR family transcriptional regulator [Cellulomonas rhizosphaerae]RHA37661.1 TetR/AcrR family transcriptional regulator [Cellulomonas rhizosphaerae]